ncbi:hypothetical protein FRC17_004767 [Serendipita sp. 399]|nr:hypothetical protein FRC17_004767 [Serendipita sp. 399]
MNVELQRYEQLANPNPAKSIKSKSPAISETLSGLSQRLKKARDQLASDPEASPAVVQLVFQAALADIESSKVQIDDRLKETHASGTKIGKLIDKLEEVFTREYCAERQISHQAPLKVVSTIGGGIALPRIEKGKKIMKERRGEWSHTEEIPVEIPLPPENRYHSVFTCPVSKEQATDVNPPMMLQCGHVIVRESLHKLIKGQT